MRFPLLELNDDVLLLILSKAVSGDPLCIDDFLLVCQRFRSVLLAAATAVTIACNDPPHLRHCRALQSMTLTNCSRLPWTVAPDTGTPRCAPNELSHLSTLTRIDASKSALSDAAEMSKLRCLPQLRHLRVSNEATDAALAVLPELTSLRTVDLSGCVELTAASLPLLSRLTFLESLDIRHSALSPNDCLLHITGLTALTQFLFNRPSQKQRACRGDFRDPVPPVGIKDDGFASLASLTSLVSLDLSDRAVAGSNAGLQQVSALRDLELLDLSFIHGLLHEHLAFVSCLTRLHTLRLRFNLRMDFNRGLKHVAGLTRLRELTFHDERVNDEGLQHLMRLTALTALNLKGCSTITAAGFECLLCLKSLRVINLTDVPLAGVFPHLTCLQDLHEIEKADADDAALVELCKVSMLRRLTLRDVTMPGLVHVTKLRALESLVVAGYAGLDAFATMGIPTPVTSADWNHLLMHVGGLTKLTQLELSTKHLVEGEGQSGPTDEGFHYLSPLHKLPALELAGLDSLTGSGLAGFTRLTALTRIQLQTCTRLSQLTLPPHLRHIDLQGCSAITDGCLDALRGLHALSHLCLQGCSQLTDAGLVRLRDLTTLTSLNLAGCELVTGGGMQQLSRLRALQVLELSECPLLGAGAMAELGRLRMLTELELAHCTGVPDEGLSHLAHLTRLKNLGLAHVPLTSDGLAHVARVTTLKYLDLRGCPHITDESMAHLTSLRLSSLALSESISEAGLEYVEGALGDSVHVWIE